jgi:hypothetical protein
MRATRHILTENRRMTPICPALWGAWILAQEAKGVAEAGIELTAAGRRREVNGMGVKRCTKDH